MHRSEEGVTRRLARYIRETYPKQTAEQALELLAEWPGSCHGERVLAAVVLRADGDLDALVRELDAADIDYRDVLLHSPLAHENWRRVLRKKMGRA